MHIISNKIKIVLGVFVYSLAISTWTIANEPPKTAKKPASILVTYQDRSIERSAIVDHYRVRSVYNSTSWAQRKANEISKQYHLKLQTQWPISELGIHCVVYQIPANASVNSILTELRKNRRIESAQVMRTFVTMAQQIYNDAYFDLQINFHLMQIQAAQKITTGKHVKIVVIDTGIDKQHQDLKGQIVKANDYSETLPNRASSLSSVSTQDDAHGTAVAGIISALAGNGVGIVGIAPDAQLISLKACAATKSYSLKAVCNSLTLAQALNQAIRMRPDIINMSLGGPVDPLIHRLIERALEDGIIVVAAASTLTDNTVSFPASMQGVIAVSDRPERNTHALIAPGMNILSTVPGNTYKYVSGSSISTATISGLIALMLELKPKMSALDATSALRQASTHEKGNNKKMVINACRMLRSIQIENSATVSSCKAA